MTFSTDASQPSGPNKTSTSSIFPITIGITVVLLFFFITTTVIFSVLFCYLKGKKIETVTVADNRELRDNSVVAVVAVATTASSDITGIPVVYDKISDTIVYDKISEYEPVNVNDTGRVYEDMDNIENNQYIHSKFCAKNEIFNVEDNPSYGCVLNEHQSKPVYCNVHH